MAGPAWKTGWPSSKSVKQWIVTSGEKALAIQDPEQRLDKLSFAIQRLIDRGHRAAARPLFADLGREIAARPQLIDASLRFLAEAYIGMGKRSVALEWYTSALARVRADKKRKPARREDAVRDLRREALYHGLTELFDDLDPAERAEADYEVAAERAEAALKKKDYAAARQHARAAEDAANKAPGNAGRFKRTRLLRIYADAGDKASALRMLDSLKEDDRTVDMVGKPLMKLGLRDLAVELARRQVRAELEDARAMDLPNYHFPAMSIAGAISFLIDHGEEDEARRQIEQVGKEIGSWQTDRSGWVEAAVYSELAVPAARLHGRGTAERMLGVAADAAKTDRTSFRSGAWDSIIEVYQTVGAWDEALALAKKYGSREDRRRRTACVLAKAGRWKELAQVLDGVESPTEASEVAWWVAAKLDGL